MTNNILINYFDDSNFTQNLKSRQNEIDSLLSNIIKKREKIKERERNTFKSDLINFIKIDNIRLTISPTQAPAPEFKQILQLAKELTNKNNSKIYFVYLPAYYRYTNIYDNTNYNLVKGS